MAVAVFGFGPAALALYLYLAVLFYRSPRRHRCVALFLAIPPLAMLAAPAIDRPFAAPVLLAMGLLALAAPLELAWRARNGPPPWRGRQFALLPVLILICWYLFAIAAESSLAV